MHRPPKTMPETDLQHLRVLIANEKRDRLELLAQVVIGLGHDVIAREIYVKEVGAGHRQGAPRRRPGRARVELRPRARADLRDRPRSRLPGDRDPPRRRPRLRPRGRQARRLRLHHRRHPRRAAKRDRHHAPALQRVPEPPGSVRAPRHDRAGKGHPHGPPLDQCRHAPSNGSATTPSTTAASSATSPPLSSTATFSSFLRRRPLRSRSPSDD